MAVYASALVVAGVALRSALNRILGLGLLALVIAKLYLLDVWSLSRGFRITAFLALGGLLLLVSYLYSRFKPALEDYGARPVRRLNSCLDISRWHKPSKCCRRWSRLCGTRCFINPNIRRPRKN